MRQLPEGKADDEPRLLRPGTESPLQIPLQPLLPITLVRITKDVDGGSKQTHHEYVNINDRTTRVWDGMHNLPHQYSQSFLFICTVLLKKLKKTPALVALKQHPVRLQVNSKPTRAAFKRRCGRTRPAIQRWDTYYWYLLPPPGQMPATSKPYMLLTYQPVTTDRIIYIQSPLEDILLLCVW